MFKNFITPKTLFFLALTGITITSCSKKEEIVPQEQSQIQVSTTSEDSELSAEATKSTAAISVAGSSLKLGINGHPLGTIPYTSTSATKQIQLLKNMGMTWYRYDVQSTSTGAITVPHLFEPLQIASANGGVKMLPMLYTRTLDLKVSQAESYKRGKILGSNFAAKYGKYFTHYNLGNELEMKCLYPNKSGKSQENYDRAKFNVIAAYLKGMDEGIKSKDPGAKTMVDASWLHYGFLRMLEWYGVKFDIVAYHWYSEMEGAAAGSMYKIPDITLKLSSLFKKPIWFTEVNSRYKTSSTYEKDQNDFITKFIEKCKRNPQVEVVMLYELFNEPQKSYILEANYGIYKWTVPFTSWSGKMVANSLQAR